MIKVRLPAGPPRQGRRRRRARRLVIETTVGRVLFNAMLPEGMPFYNDAHALRRPGRA